MDIYQTILQLTEEELPHFIEERIKQLEENKKQATLGYIIVGKDQEKILVKQNRIYKDYIPKGSIIKNYLSISKDGVNNEEKTFELDDDSYLLDFCNFIKEIEITDEYDLLAVILDFLIYRFGPPVEERGKGKTTMKNLKGKAMCSEYAAVAQNIFSFLGISSYFIMGKLNKEEHAFNLISFEEQETKEKITMLVDFANFTPVLDTDYQMMGQLPYTIITEEDLDPFMNKEEAIICEEYSYMMVENDLQRMTFDARREYSVPHKIVLDKTYVK